MGAVPSFQISRVCLRSSKMNQHRTAICCGLNVKGPPEAVCLNPWPPAGGAALEGYRSFRREGLAGEVGRP